MKWKREEKAKMVLNRFFAIKFLTSRIKVKLTAINDEQKREFHGKKTYEIGMHEFAFDYITFLS